MRKYSRFTILSKFKAKQIVSFQEFYQLYYQETKNSLVAFYSFLRECTELGLIKNIAKGKYQILKTKGD